MLQSRTEAQLQETTDSRAIRTKHAKRRRFVGLDKAHNMLMLLPDVCEKSPTRTRLI